MYTYPARPEVPLLRRGPEEATDSPLPFGLKTEPRLRKAEPVSS